MASTKKIIAINVVALGVIAVGGIWGSHAYDQKVNYIKTENAMVDGNQIVLSAPASGKLTDWNGTLGSYFSKDGAVGQIATGVDATGEVKGVDVTVPQDMTIVADNVIPNSNVAAGTPIAYGYDMDKLYITANIEETEVSDLNVGQEVDIKVDALGDEKLKGEIAEIGLTTAGTFSALPSSNSDSNYTKVTQVVPVKIQIDNLDKEDILPGMNATVWIHK